MKTQAIKEQLQALNVPQKVNLINQFMAEGFDPDYYIYSGLDELLDQCTLCRELAIDLAFSNIKSMDAYLLFDVYGKILVVDVQTEFEEFEEHLTEYLSENPQIAEEYGIII